MISSVEPIGELEAAVEANDASAVRRVLHQHPALAARLDDPLPHAPFGATALLRAVHRNNREMIDVLLAAGADINQRSHWWAGSFGVLDHDGPLSGFLIERGAVVDAHAAARLGMNDRLRELVAADPGVVGARGGDGQTPLHFASSVEIAAFLIDHGADVDARDVDHESTPAQWMIRDRQPIVRCLIDRGCTTDILMAAAIGDAALVRAHLDANPASVATAVSDDFFPKRDPRSGGCIYIWTLGGNKTAHVVAREFGHEDVYSLLMERTPDELKLAIAGAQADETALSALLARRPDLLQTLDEGQRRAIVNAAEGNHTRAVALMTAAGWPLDVRGREGATALHWASFHGNAAMVRDLLRRGAPVDPKDATYGGTPIGWAIYGSVHGWHSRDGDYAGAVEALLDHGAVASPDAMTDASEAVRAVLRRRGIDSSSAREGSTP